MNKLQIFSHLPLKIGIFTQNSVAFRILAKQKGDFLAKSPLGCYIYIMMGRTIGLRLVLE